MITDGLINAYLRKAYSPLISYMRHEVKCGKKIALWGAGQKGKKFLEIADDENNLITYVFDKDEHKLGLQLPTGHVVCDYKKCKADIVIVSGNNIILETRYRFSKLLCNPEIINLDDIVLGNFNPYEKKSKEVPFRKKHNMVAAMVILFNPENDVVENIRSYINQVDMLFLYDNSPYSNAKMFSEFLEQDKCQYVYANGNNDGLGKPINVVAKLALNKGADWLMTFDQDSAVYEDMVVKMRNYIDSTDLDSKIAILTPTIISPTDSNDGIEYAIDDAFIMYVRNAIQSGSLINLHMMEDVGGYYEDLFIDYVDFEYCLRMRSKGYAIGRLVNARLIHQKGNKDTVYELNGIKIYLGKYSPQRYYYQYRNIAYCIEKYVNFDPIFAKSCKKNLDELELAAKIDDNSSMNLEAVSRAKKDYLLL